MIFNYDVSDLHSAISAETTARENADIDLSDAITSLSGILTASQLSDLSVSSSHFIQFSANVTVGGVIIPRYSKGVLVATSSDAALYAIDSQGNLYTAFRSDGTWVNGSSGKLASYTTTTPSNVICAQSVTTAIAGLSLTPGFWLVTATHEFTQSSNGTYIDTIQDSTSGLLIAVSRNLSMLNGGGATSTGFVILANNSTINYSTLNLDTESRVASHIRMAAIKIG